MSFKYILNAVKENFQVRDKYEEEGFPDLNYEVGNTSGMDAAPGVPSAMHERIGSLAMRGGSVMEVIINNPATFQIDRDQMLDVINGLEIDISLHSNPDVGYTSPYRAQYDPTHKYFTQYLEQFASFKKTAENRSKKERDFGFNISRINPHICTSPRPAIEEERAQDTSLDPFGYSLTDLKNEVMKGKDDENKNIFRNEEFLRRLYRVFIVDTIEQNEYRYYQDIFSDFSDRFDSEWRKTIDEKANEEFLERSKSRESRLKEKVTMIGTGAAGDSEITTIWYDLLKEPVDEDLTIELTSRSSPVEINSLEDLDTVIRGLSVNYDLSMIRRLPEIYRLLESEELELNRVLQNGELITEDEEILEAIEEPLERAIEKLWEYKKEGGEPLIPIQNKLAAVSRNFEIPQQRIIEEAFTSNRDKIRNHAENMVAGDDSYFDNENSTEDQHLLFLQRLTGSLQNQMWMESNVIYKIIPAWMAVADEDFSDKGYKKREAPKFLWELLIKQKWSEYDIDLLEPRKNDGKGFLDLLENNREFQEDVAAASAACYVWGHFTQQEGQFMIDDKAIREYLVHEYEEEEDVLEKFSNITWIEWMNEFGIGVNLEAMPGDTRQPYKIWRPRHTVAAARAINIGARDKLDDIHPDLYGMPAKFTLDLEHVATFGEDPWKTMENLIEQEENLVKSGLASKYDIGVEKEKPLAKIMRMWHLMKPGLETSQSRTLHGPWDKGDKQLYEWLWNMVKAGFGRDNEKAYVMYEVGGDDRGVVYTARIAMNLIELGVSPEELDPSKVNPGEEYRDEKEALMARFFGMDRPTYDREWAKIEQHAFDPLQSLLEAEQFDYTYSSNASMENNNQPGEWMQEEYK